MSGLPSLAADPSVAVWRVLSDSKSVHRHAALGFMAKECGLSKKKDKAKRQGLMRSMQEAEQAAFMGAKYEFAVYCQLVVDSALKLSGVAAATPKLTATKRVAFERSAELNWKKKMGGTATAAGTSKGQIKKPAEVKQQPVTKKKASLSQSDGHATSTVARQDATRKRSWAQSASTDARFDPRKVARYLADWQASIVELKRLDPSRRIEMDGLWRDVEYMRPALVTPKVGAEDERKLKGIFDRVRVVEDALSERKLQTMRRGVTGFIHDFRSDFSELPAKARLIGRRLKLTSVLRVE